jgi:hypothetical protein
VSAAGGSLHVSGRFRTAAIAALVATAGDVLMLLVANGEAGSPASAVAGSLLVLGGALGVVAIPLFYVGYQAVASLLRLSAAWHRICMLGAALVAMFGAITHALAALDIRAAHLMGLGVRPPEEAFADMSSPLFVVAMIAAAGATIAAAGMVAGLPRHDMALKLAVILNPVVWTIVLSAAAAASEPLAAYVIPSAPNLAHLLFFAVLACVSRSRTKFE